MLVDMELEVMEPDTDLNGHMNHVQYIYYLEQARHTWYKGIGMPVKKLIEEDRIGTVVVHLETDFKKEARLGDKLIIHTTLAHVGTKSFTLQQEIINEQKETIAEASILNVAEDAHLKERSE